MFHNNKNYNNNHFKIIKYAQLMPRDRNQLSKYLCSNYALETLALSHSSLTSWTILQRLRRHSDKKSNINNSLNILNIYLEVMRKKSRHIKSLKLLTDKKSNSYWKSYQYCQTVSKMNARQYMLLQDRSHCIPSNKPKILSLQISSLCTSSQDYLSLCFFSASRNTVTHVFNQKM